MMQTRIRGNGNSLQGALHDSELIEGGVAARVLEHANRVGGGFYVAVYGEYQDADYDNEIVIEGWSIAYQGKAI